MVAILDKSGRVLDCNNHFAENMECEKNEVLGKIAPIDFVLDKDRQKAVSAFNEVVEKGMKRDVHLEIVKKNGLTYPSIWSGATFYDEYGNLKGYIVTGKDLSEIYQLKNLIKETQEQNQKEKMILLGQLTGRIAHDIKNPLNILNMSIEILKNHPELKLSDESVQDKINKMSKNISRINNQVNLVLDHIREKRIYCKKTLLNNCIEEAIKQIIIPENVKINIEKSQIFANVDLFQTGIAISNIINNSIQSLNGNHGEISIKLFEDNEFSIIEISDSGQGIPDEILPYIFEPFVTTKQEGTGLGLVSCRNIIEIQNGIIYANNNPTTFVIKFPKK